MNNSTPTPWYFEEADSGDRSVGIQPSPAFIYGEQKITPDWSEPVEIAYLNPEPKYQLPREFWTDEEIRWNNDPETRYSFDFPIGSRSCGDPTENAKRIVAAVNATAAWSTWELEGMNFHNIITQMIDVIEGLKHDKSEYIDQYNMKEQTIKALKAEVDRLNNIINKYEMNFKQTGDIWDNSWEGTNEED